MKNIIIFIVTLWLPWIVIYFPLCLIVWLFSADTVEFREIVGNEALLVAIFIYIFLYLPFTSEIAEKMGAE